MLGVPTIWVCSEDFWGASAHVFISEMESLGVRLCLCKLSISLSIQSSLCIPTTLRFAPLFQVSGGMLAEIPFP